MQLYYMELSEPKSVNPVLDIIGVNSLRLEGLHIARTHQSIYLLIQIGKQNFDRKPIVT